MVLYLSSIGSGCTGNIFLLTNLGTWVYDCRLTLHNHLSFSARAEGLMKFDPTATEENIKVNVSEHLKPRRKDVEDLQRPDKPAPSLHAGRRF